MFIDAVYDYVSDASNNAPFGDWYETTNGDVEGFRARPVVGGHLGMYILPPIFMMTTYLFSSVKLWWLSLLDEGWCCILTCSTACFVKEKDGSPRFSVVRKMARWAYFLNCIKRMLRVKCNRMICFWKYQQRTVSRPNRRSRHLHPVGLLLHCRAVSLSRMISGSRLQPFQSLETVIHQSNSPHMESLSSKTVVSNWSEFPSCSKPINLCAVKRMVYTWQCYTHFSLDMPLTKHITQGRTLIPSFSTNHGTFSTNTRAKRVEKYFAASFWKLNSSEWIKVRNSRVLLDVYPWFRIV